MAPQQRCADPDRCGDRRRKRDGVVGMHDAAGEAEHHCGHRQPAAPQDQRRPHRIRPWCTSGDDEPRRDADHRGGQQPRDVQTHGGAEQPAPADVDVEVAQPARLVTGQAAEAVVPQHQFDDAVVLRTADVGPLIGRPQLAQAAETSRRTPPARPRRRAGRRPGAASDRGRQPGTPRRNRATPGPLAASWPETQSPPRHPRRSATDGCCRFRTPRWTQYAAATSSSTSRASGLLNRNINAATGVSANTAPASSAAPSPLTRRTAAYSSATAPTPSSACGTSTLHELSPNSRTDTSITHSAAGVLSTVMALAASLDPNSIAVQLARPGLRGGRVERVGPAAGRQVPQIQRRGRGQQPRTPSRERTRRRTPAAGFGRGRVSSAGRARVDIESIFVEPARRRIWRCCGLPVNLLAASPRTASCPARCARRSCRRGP